MTQLSEKVTIQITNKNEDTPRLMLAVSGSKSIFVVAFVYNLERDECLLILRKRGSDRPFGWQLMGGDPIILRQLDSLEILTGDYLRKLEQLEQVSNELSDIHYKGSWSATLELEEQPNGTVEALLMMKRSIGHRTMVISGHFTSAGIQWQSLVQRGAHWAAEPVAVKKGQQQLSLKTWIAISFQQLMSTTASWCAVKENTRRASMDADYAILHPIKPGKPTKPKAVAEHFKSKVKTVEAVASTGKPKVERKPRKNAPSQDKAQPEERIISQTPGPSAPIQTPNEGTSGAGARPSLPAVPPSTPPIDKTTVHTAVEPNPKSEGTPKAEAKPKSERKQRKTVPASNSKEAESRPESDAERKARMSQSIRELRGTLNELISAKKRSKANEAPEVEQRSSLRAGPLKLRRRGGL